MEIELNSNDHKISNNRLRYYFNDITKFENNSVSLMECVFIHVLKILSLIIRCELNMKVVL